MIPSENTFEVSVIIPVLTGHENLKRLLLSLNRQTLLPTEIIIVDSCLHTEVKELIEDTHLEIPINYHRTEERAFPGKARNIGVSIAKSEYIAFLDCRTIPTDEWLHHYSQIIKEHDDGIVLGSTKVLTHNKFQWYLRAASYGTKTHDTLPGTLLERKLFNITNGFVEHLRMAEDLEWFQRLKKHPVKTVSVAATFIEYDGLPESLYAACLKHLISGYYTSFVMDNYKNFIYVALSIAAILIIPRWNFLIGDWSSNPLFIPNVTKIFFLTLFVLFLIWRLIYFFIPREWPNNIFILFSQLSILGIATYSISKWNASMAFWVEDAVLYIPHITKIYLGVLLGSVFIYRGLIKPMMNGTLKRKLLPQVWLIVGILGLLLDILKVPGYITGAIVGRIQELASLFKNVDVHQ